MSDRIFEARSDADVLEAVRWARGNATALAIRGAGTKSGWGRFVEVSASLSVAGLTGIDYYEPEELVLSARAGTPMAEIEQRLAQHGQQLAFEPPDLGPLFGKPAGAGTLGGAVGCNLSGPRRIHAGAARDHVLGFSGVNGLGEAFKAGGRVVKNVTGFDLSKLIAGSFGTLAVMTEVTLKVLPASEVSRSVLVFGLESAQAIEAMGSALRSPHDVNGAAHLPHAVAAKSRVASLASAGAPVTALRLEGTERSVAARAAALIALLKPFGAIAEIAASESRQLWAEVRDVAPLLGDGASQIWHLSVPPSQGAAVAAAVAEGSRAFYFDWGGGRIWLAGADATAEAPAIRTAVAKAGGHASLVRAPDDVRRRIAVFQPMGAAESALVRRLKDNFDPARLLNPGRMYEDA